MAAKARGCASRRLASTVSVASHQSAGSCSDQSGCGREVASGVLGDILHVEGHFSNEVSRVVHPAWRETPEEAPGASLTATGIHVIDAFVGLLGPVRRVDAQRIFRRPAPDPSDTIAVLLEFANRVSGTLSMVRVTPLFWRVHVFGDEGSVEAVGETEVVVRTKGGKVERREFPKVDSILAEFDAFADAVEGRAPYPITPAEMVNTISAFEAIIQSMKRGEPVSIP